jgi:hypothetical protein
MPEESRPRLGAEDAEVIRKEEVVEIYVALLDKIWQRALKILGLVTIRAILQRAIYLTSQQYPLIGQLTVSEHGLQSANMRNQLGERERQVIREGFEELILNLFDLLAKLTGETIVQKLFTDELPTRSDQPE